MRYIRIKDGKIYDTKDLTKCEDKRFPNGWFTEFGVALLSVNEADTIEALCDCVVYECLPKKYQDEYHKHEVSSVESLEWNREPKRFANVYGAIWTDKGLIYVAKMNKEGCLELI